MRRRRLLAAAFFTCVMAAVLAVIVYTERANASATVSAWMLIHDVRAGAIFSPADVEQVQVRSAPGDFNLEAQGPAQVSARYARALAAHDLLMSDDLVPAASQAEVALNVENAPVLSPGDKVDIYAALGTGQQALIGRSVAIESVSGASLTVLVPVADEPAWIAVGSSNVALHVARISVSASPPAVPFNADSAIHLLCGPSCAGVQATPVPTP